jgi:hypothetical protein
MGLRHVELTTICGDQSQGDQLDLGVELRKLAIKKDVHLAMFPG